MSRDEWAFSAAERRPGVKSPRAVVSVAFAREDFELISRAAELVGMPVSAFIRSVTLERTKAVAMVLGAYPPSVETRCVGPTCTLKDEHPDRTGILR